MEDENKEVSVSETAEEVVEKTVEGEEGTPEEKPEVKEVNEIPSAAQKRIDELTWKAKSAEEKLQILQKEREAKTILTEEEEREKKAKDYLRNLVKEVEEERKSAESEADRRLEEEIKNISSVYPDFDEKSVLNLMDKYGIENVEKGYQAWKEINRVKAEAKDTTKKEILSKPKSPSGLKTTDEGLDQSPEDKKKSLWEIVEEAKKKAGI